MILSHHLFWALKIQFLAVEEEEEGDEQVDFAHLDSWSIVFEGDEFNSRSITEFKSEKNHIRMIVLKANVMGNPYRF